MAARGSRRRRVLAWIALALLVVPTLEIAVIVRVGSWIGAWPTFLLLIAESALGAWVVRHEGARSWAALREALAQRRVPASELADAALVLVGGVLLLTPGFLTDVVGFVFVIPATRRLVRPWAGRMLADRLVTAAVPRPGTGTWSGAAPPGGAGRVVAGEVITPPPPRD